MLTEGHQRKDVDLEEGKWLKKVVGGETEVAVLLSSTAELCLEAA